jgi:hypothetical protein
MKKIIIAPVFNEGCFIDQWIPNVCDIVEPNMVILNEGMFPQGPENSSKFTKEYLKKYTSDGKRRSFDLHKIHKALEKYHKVYTNTHFVLNTMMYPEGLLTRDAYYAAYTLGVPPDLDENDIVLPMELDAFLHQDDKETLHKAFEVHSSAMVGVAMLKRYWMSPFVRMVGDKIRKLFVKWGNGTTLKQVAMRNFDDSYHQMSILYPVRLYHYEWVRTGKYLQFRKDTFTPIRTWSEEQVSWDEFAENHVIKEGIYPVPNRGVHMTLNESCEDHPEHFKQNPLYKKFSKYQNVLQNVGKVMP